MTLSATFGIVEMTSEMSPTEALIQNASANMLRHKILCAFPGQR